MKAVKQPLSNVQRELLKLYSTDITDSELRELKEILAQFYAKKINKYVNNYGM